MVGQHGYDEGRCGAGMFGTAQQHLSGAGVPVIAQHNLSDAGMIVVAVNVSGWRWSVRCCGDGGGLGVAGQLLGGAL